VTGVRDAEAQVRLAEARSTRPARPGHCEKALKDCRVVAAASGSCRSGIRPGIAPERGAPLYMLVDNSQLELECLVPSTAWRKSEPAAVEFTTPSSATVSFEGDHGNQSQVESDNRSVKISAGSPTRRESSAAGCTPAAPLSSAKNERACRAASGAPRRKRGDQCREPVRGG